MADENKEVKPAEPEGGKGGSSAAVAEPKGNAKTTPKKNPSKPLPPWKVLLHNDDDNDMAYVVESIVSLTPLREKDAVLRTIEAHESGVALLLVTHRERAELYAEQFESKGLTVTVEPAE